jgi:hypothetical protein
MDQQLTCQEYMLGRMPGILPIFKKNYLVGPRAHILLSQSFDSSLPRLPQRRYRYCEDRTSDFPSTTARSHPLSSGNLPLSLTLVCNWTRKRLIYPHTRKILVFSLRVEWILVPPSNAPTSDISFLRNALLALLFVQLGFEK